MRLLFLGSGEFGLPTLEALAARHGVLAVITQPDRPAGRKQRLTPTPIAQWADEHDLRVIKTDNANDEAIVGELRALEPEVSIIVAFGQKLLPPLVEALGDLAVNLHASLLPKYRGAAPINWAIINNEARTGVTVIGIAQKMDAGPMYAKAELAIDKLETAGELHDRLARLGPRVVEQVLRDFAAGTLQGEVQDESQATRAPKLSKADGTVDFDQAADLVRARVHGLTPWPGCRVNWHCRATGETQPLILRRVQAVPEAPAFLRRHLEDDASTPAPGTVLAPLLVACREGFIKPLELQAPGTRVMKADVFARGHHLAPGDRLEPIATPAGER